jgi:hypothetical protein
MEKDMLNGLMPLLIIICILLIFAVIIRNSRKAKNRHLESSIEESEIHEINMNNRFLDIADSTGKKAIDAVIIYSLNDLLIIRSQLFSCGIENYVKNEKLNTLFSGIGINGLTNIVLTIFEEDLNETKEIVNEFISSKSRQRKAKGKKELLSKARNIGELIITGRYVSNSVDMRDPEII